MEWAEYALQDSAHIRHDPTGREIWDYEGLHVFGDGDRLRVLTLDGAHVAWSGTITFRPVWWRRWYRRVEVTPRGIPPDQWEEWFTRQHPAALESAG